MIIFNYLNDFSYFPLYVAGHDQSRYKITTLKGGVDGSAIFFYIYFNNILFSKQYHLCKSLFLYYKTFTA
jgi:hypothetical protein